MNAETAREFPDSLDGVQVGAVRRQEVEKETATVLFPPLFVETGMVILGVVHNEDDLAVGSRGGAPQLPEKVEEGLRIEAAFLAAKDQPAVAEAKGPKVSDTPARRMMEQNGIFHFRGNPHPATGSVLLEVHLVQRPQVDARISGQPLEFFYAPRVAGGLPGQ